MESKMKPESIKRSRVIAEQEILTIKLGQLRERLVKNRMNLQILVKHQFQDLKNEKI